MVAVAAAAVVVVVVVVDESSCRSDRVVLNVTCHVSQADGVTTTINSSLFPTTTTTTAAATRLFQYQSFALTLVQLVCSKTP